MQDQEKALTILFLNVFRQQRKDWNAVPNICLRWNLVNSANTGYDY